MKKNQPKLSWFEMNKKQKVFFVIDWIMRVILIALSLIIISTMFVSCFKSCKDEEASLVYASDEDVSTFSSYVTTIDYQNNYSNVPYFHIFNDSGASDGLLAQIKLINYVFTKTTFEIVVNSDPSLIFFNLAYDDGTYYDLRFTSSGNVAYCTIDLTENFKFIYLQCRPNGNDNVSINFNVYTYIGSYVSGYGQGLAAGLQQGNAEGYNKGVEDSQYGAFKGATVDITQEFSDRSNQSFLNLIPNYVYQGINSLNLNQYYDGIPDLQYCTFTINFKEPFLYDQNRNTLFFSGSLVGLTLSATIITPDNNYETFDIKYEPYGALLNENITTTLISKIEFTVGRPTDLGQWWLNSADTGTADYNYGYNTGYSEGYNIGFNIGNNGGYDHGFDEGYSSGFQEGFNQSESGGFSWLISSVQQFLNTKFFGDFGIGTLLYVALGVALALYFLKVFAGG